MAAAMAAAPRRNARRSRSPFPATTSSSSTPRFDRLLGIVFMAVLLRHRESKRLNSIFPQNAAGQGGKSVSGESRGFIPHPIIFAEGSTTIILWSEFGCSQPRFLRDVVVVFLPTLSPGTYLRSYPAIAIRSPCKRIGAELDPHHFRAGAFTGFEMERNSVAVGRPQSSPLPAGIRIVDAPIQPFGKKAHGIGDAKINELPIDESEQRLVGIAGGDGYVLAQSERVVLIHPGVVARLGAA